MKQQKEMPVETNSPAPRYRYWFTPPRSITLKASDLKPFVPKASWKAPAPDGLTFEIPADKVLSKNVPRIPLRLLAELLPDHVLSSDGMVKLPAARLAAAYRLVQHREELPPEVLPEPEVIPEPELPPAAALPEVPVVPEVPAADAPEVPLEKTAPDAGPPAVIPSALSSAEPPVLAGMDTMPEMVDTAPISEPPPTPPAPVQRPVIPARKLFSAPILPFASPSGHPARMPEPTTPLPPAAPGVSSAAAAPDTSDAGPAFGLNIPSVDARPAVEPEAVVPEITPPPVVPQHVPAPDATSVASSKFPPRRTGSFVGLPIFRRRTPAPAAPPAPVVPVENPPADLPPAGQPPAAVIPAQVAPEPVVPVPPPVEEPRPDVISTPDLTVHGSISQPPEPEAAPAMTARLLPTEHFATPSQEGQEIVEQEPLQALFLTEEPMSVRRVIELCGGLPGINSCVLAHGSVVVASHNVPESVDLVSMSAHAAEMLRAMRDSSARMGVGTVPAVTLHTEKGVISFFNREDLTLLVFHKDRGFVPGVREKMAAVLGELTKARLTLPVGGEENL